MTAFILIIFATAIIYFYFGIEQLFQHKRKWYGLLIAGFFISLSLCLMVACAHFSGLLIYFPRAHQIHIPFYYSLGPLCYLIFIYNNAESNTFQKRSYLHFIAPLLSFIVMIPHYLTSIENKFTLISTTKGMGWHWTEYVEQFGGLVLLYYLGWIYLEYSRNRLWNRYSIIFFSVTAFTSFVEVILIGVAFIFQSDMLFIWALALQLLYITAVYFLARIFPDYFLRLSISPRAYRNSSLTKLNEEEVDKKLNQLLKQKIYLNTEINSTLFSQALGISNRQLSEYLSQKHHENFSIFINRFRIEYAKTVLTQSPHKKIIEIAFDAGFNSVSVFNTAFKAFNGITPREYRKSNTCR